MRTATLISSIAAAVTIAGPAMAQARGGVLSTGVVQLVVGLALLGAVLWYALVAGFGLETKHRNRFGVDEYANGAEYARHNFAKAGLKVIVAVVGAVAIGLILWGGLKLAGAA